MAGGTTPEGDFCVVKVSIRVAGGTKVTPEGDF